MARVRTASLSASHAAADPTTEASITIIKIVSTQVGAIRLDTS
jgi:hypothetical protein